jgi:hypothetical protein
MTSEGKAQLAGIQVLRRAVPPAKSGPVTRRLAAAATGKDSEKIPKPLLFILRGLNSYLGNSALPP